MLSLINRDSHFIYPLLAYRLQLRQLYLLYRHAVGRAVKLLRVREPWDSRRLAFEEAEYPCPTLKRLVPAPMLPAVMAFLPSALAAEAAFL